MGGGWNAPANEVLVTGHTGFIGRATGLALDAAGIKWRGVSMSEPLPEAQRLRRLDGVGSAPVILHLAGNIGSSIQSWSDEAGHCIADNALLALAVQRCARRCGSFVVYLTTQKGESPYHLGKQMGEDILRDLPLMVLRLTNAYGSGQRRGLMKGLGDQARAGGPIRVNSRAPRRDWLHVDDVARCLVMAAQRRIPGTFDLCAGRQHSVGEVVDLVLDHVGPRQVVETGVEPHETMDVSGISPAALRCIDWRPQVTLEQGIAEMFGKAKEVAA